MLDRLDRIAATLDTIRAFDGAIAVYGDSCFDVHLWIEKHNGRDTVARERTTGGMADAVCAMARTIAPRARISHAYPVGRSAKTYLVVGGRIERVLHNDRLIEAEDAGGPAWLLADQMRASKFDALLLCDHAKGSLSGVLPQLLVCVAKIAGVPVVVDPARGRSWRDYHGATVIKSTLAEYHAAPSTHSGGAHVVTTDGANGMSCFPRGEGLAPFHVPAWPVADTGEFDATGSGDMVMACLGLALACGLPLRDGLELGAFAAALECGKVGAVPVTPAEIRAAIEAARAGQLVNVTT